MLRTMLHMMRIQYRLTRKAYVLSDLGPFHLLQVQRLRKLFRQTVVLVPHTCCMPGKCMGFAVCLPNAY